MGIEKNRHLIYWLFFLVLLTSSFFKLKIVNELPLGMVTNEYGLQGFDDEPAHLNYTLFLIENRDFPILESVITDEDALIKNEFEYHQPPLYYLVIAGISNLFGISNPNSILIIGRYFNFIFSILAIPILFGIFEKLGLTHLQNLITISIYLLLGSVVYQSSVFGNDMLSWFFIWWIIFLLLDSFEKHWLLISILIGISILIKFSVFPIFAFMIYPSLLIMKKNKKKKTSFILTAFFVIPIFIALPWLIRNYLIYANPIFPIFSETNSTWVFVNNIPESIQKIIHVPYLLFFRMQFIPTKFFISVFNYLSYLWLLLALLYWFKTIKINFDRFEKRTINSLLILYLLSYFYYAIPTGFTEARLIFPVLPAILLALVSPIFNYINKNDRKELMIYLVIILILVPPFFIGFYF